jgi:hypothetical protein
MLVPPAEMRAAAQAVANREGLPDDWLNDAVKGFFSEHGDFVVFEELSNLRVYVPHTGYLLAMKCLALRLGEEFRDLEDVAVLVRELGLRSVGEAESILGQYYDLARYPAKARFVLEELIGTGNAAADSEASDS